MSAPRPPLACPACKTGMQPRTFVDLTLDVCPACKGTWFDAEELATAAKVPLPTAERMGGSSRTCPCCHAAMEQSAMGGVVVDRCPRCRGVFLDRGEMERLQRGDGSKPGRRPTSAAGDASVWDYLLKGWLPFP